MSFDPGTWTCMVCGDERPDAQISVCHVPLPGAESGFPGTRINVRYCNDRVACVEGAPNYKLGAGR